MKHYEKHLEGVFQPHYRYYRRLGLVDEFTETLALMRKDYRVHVTQQMILGVTA